MLHTKTPITKPFLTFEKKKSGIPDMIPEKKTFYGYRPFKEQKYKR